MKDVKSASIVPDDKGSIMEAHIVAAMGRSPKQIARDVESMLVAKLGIPIDHRKISVAQIEEDAEIEAKARAQRKAPEPVAAEEERETPHLRGGYLDPEDYRVEFVGVSVAQSKMRAEARVELRVGELDSVAGAVGADSKESVMRLIAVATLEAVGQFFEDECVLAVEAIEQCSVGGRPVIVASVCHLSNGEEKTLVGACPANGDVPRAAALATLDAVNRFLRRLVRKEPVEYVIGPAPDDSTSNE